MRLCKSTFTIISSLPCLHTFWHAIPTTFLMFFKSCRKRETEYSGLLGPRASQNLCSSLPSSCRLYSNADTSDSENFRKVKRSGKAGSRRESNPGHLACAASALPVLCHWSTTTGQPPALIIFYPLTEFWWHILNGCWVCDWGISVPPLSACLHSIVASVFSGRCGLNGGPPTILGDYAHKHCSWGVSILSNHPWSRAYGTA